MRSTIYIITNSYPEAKHSFNTDEFEYVMKNYDAIKILSFSNEKCIKKNIDTITLNIKSGIREFFSFRTIKNIKKHKKIFLNLIDNSILNTCKNIYSYFIALSILRKVNFDNNDLIFSYWLTRSSIVAMYLSWLTNIDYICQGHGSDIYLNNSRTIKKILLYSKKIITVSEANRKYIELKYNVDKQKTIVFKLGVNKSFINSTIINKSIERNKIKFITVGHFTDIKGIDILLEAIKLLIKNDTSINNVEFNIYGGGKNFNKYKKYILENKLEEYINIFHWVNKEDLYKLYTSADCYILPSRSEGLPVVLMEACSAHLPIIASNVGGVSEIAIEGENGFLCKSCDPVAIYNAICKFISLETKDIIEMANKSYDIYLLNYQLENNLDEKYNYIINKI